MGISQHPSKGGIPSGNTAGRPSNPVIGDTYYNGQLEILEIFNGTEFVAISAPPATPLIASVTDIGTGLAFATGGTFTVAITPGIGGSTPSQFNASTTAGGFSASNSTSPISLTGLTSGTSFAVVANAQNNFGSTVNSAPSSSVVATTVPQAPTIGTTTLSFGLPVVNWTLGNNGGKNLSAITITPYLNGSTAETSRTAATTNSTSYTFTPGQLTEDSSYTFRVKATNANGVGLESSASNSVTVDAEINVDFLIVAGGGGGSGGGGGAGGLRTSAGTSGGGASAESASSVTANTNYFVTVGGGGASGSNIANNGANGTLSTFSTITSAGGGGGAGQSGGTGGNGVAGGCGGGASVYAINTLFTGAAGTENQGFAGGNASGGSIDYASAGGGGAGSVGASATSNTGSGGGAVGGSGVSSSITGTAVTYSVGGTGYVSGGTTSPVNLGRGGAGKIVSGGGNGLEGGSGVVILRYPDTRTITIGAGLTGTESAASGGYKRATITAGTGNVSWT